MGVIYGLRTVIFYVLLSLSALVWCLVSLLIAPFLSFPARYRFINVYWCRFAVGLGKYIIGLNYRVTGVENIPKHPIDGTVRYFYPASSLCFWGEEAPLLICDFPYLRRSVVSSKHHIPHLADQMKSLGVLNDGVFKFIVQVS